ncbi:unnamed protein product, partial [Chrysoparadoxa australica]
EHGAAASQFWHRLLSWSRETWVVLFTTPGDSQGTVSGSKTWEGGLLRACSYTCLRVLEVGRQKLVQLRGPLPPSGWEGIWASSSELWTPEVLAEVGDGWYHAQADTFWLSFSELLKLFTKASCCMARRPSPWRVVRRKCRIKRGSSGCVVGSHRNVGTMYNLAAHEKCQIIVSLHQPDVRGREAKPYVDIGVAVLRVNRGWAFELVAASSIVPDRYVCKNV